MPIYLGVNIDHIATIRQARGTCYPDPVQAGIEAEQAGADSITLHLREDRRHIQERDLALLSDIVQTKLNLEMAVTEEMLLIAEKYQPADCCLVPEKREELTTEGGLNVSDQLERMQQACRRLARAGVRVSLFIDPAKQQIDAAVACEAPVIELHTGHYAEAPTEAEAARELLIITKAAEYADAQGLQVNAGHGLHYHNTAAIAMIPQLVELNIGHAIVARALFSGLQMAVKDMKNIMLNARYG